MKLRNYIENLVKESLNGNQIVIDRLNKEYKKLSKIYFSLEEKNFKTPEEERELDRIEQRLSEIANTLERL